MTKQSLEDEEKMHKAAGIIRRLLAKLRDEIGMDQSALASAALDAGIAVSIEGMGRQNTADWLRDLADAIEGAESDARLGKRGRTSSTVN